MSECINKADKFAVSARAVTNFMENCAKFVGEFLQKLNKAMPDGIKAHGNIPLIPVHTEGGAKTQIADTPPSIQNSTNVEPVASLNIIEKQESEKLVLYNMIENPAVTKARMAKLQSAEIASNVTPANSADAEPAQRINLLSASDRANDRVNEPRVSREVVAERVRRGEMFLDSSNFTRSAEGVWSAPDTPWKFRADNNGRWLAQRSNTDPWIYVDSSASTSAGDQRIATLLQFMRQSSSITPEHVQDVLRANKRQEMKREGSLWLLQNGCTPYTGAGGGFEYSTGFSFNLNPQFQFVDGKWAVRWRTRDNWSDPSTVRAPSGRGETAINAILGHLSVLNTRINEAGTLHAGPSDATAAGPAAVVNLVPAAPAELQRQAEPQNPEQRAERERQKEMAANSIGIFQNNTAIAAQQYAKDGSPGNLVNIIQAAQEELTALRRNMILMQDEPEISKNMAERIGQIQTMLTEGKLVEHVTVLAKRADDALARARARVNEVIGREQQTIINENVVRKSGGWFGGVHRAITNSNPYEIQITNANMTISRMRLVMEQIDKAIAQPDALTKIRAAETAFSFIRNANRSNAQFNQEMYKLEQEAITVSRDIAISVSTTIATLGTSAAFSLAARGATAAAGAASNTGVTTILSILRQGGVKLAQRGGQAALKALPSAVGVTTDEMRTKTQGGTIDSGDVLTAAMSVADQVGQKALSSPFGKASGVVRRLAKKLLG